MHNLAGKAINCFCLISFILFLFSLSPALEAQNNVGINSNGQAPDPSSELDIYSLDKGLLIPRTPDTSNIKKPTATSLLVFQNKDNTFYYWNGTKWVALGGKGAIGTNRSTRNTGYNWYNRSTRRTGYNRTNRSTRNTGCNWSNRSHRSNRNLMF